MPWHATPLLKESAIGDSSSIRSLVAPVTAVIAFVMLREKITLTELVLMLISVIGMIFIAQPWNERSVASILSQNRSTNSSLSTAEDTLSNYSYFQYFTLKYPSSFGTLLCLVSVFSNSFTIVAMRSLGKKVHYRMDLKFCSFFL